MKGKIVPRWVKSVAGKKKKKSLDGGSCTETDSAKSSASEYQSSAKIKVVPAGEESLKEDRGQTPHARKAKNGEGSHGEDSDVSSKNISNKSLSEHDSGPFLVKKLSLESITMQRTSSFQQQRWLSLVNEEIVSKRRAELTTEKVENLPKVNDDNTTPITIRHLSSKGSLLDRNSSISPDGEERNSDSTKSFDEEEKNAVDDEDSISFEDSFLDDYDYDSVDTFRFVYWAFCNPKQLRKEKYNHRFPDDGSRVSAITFVDNNGCGVCDP